jgi:hypothetical protein
MHATVMSHPFRSADYAPLGVCVYPSSGVTAARPPLVTIELASPWALNPGLGVVARRTGGQKARGDKIGRLAGKVAIFTGAGRGIRRPMARRFAAEGAARICL